MDHWAAHRVQCLELAHKIAAERGGRCLAFEYKNANTKMEWECRKGHRWFAKLNHVKDSGSWCPSCAKLAKKNPKLIEVARKIAENRGGRCLSVSCGTIQEKLRWQCSKGHEWDAPLSRVKHANAWCYNCHYMQAFGNTIEFARELAQARGGRCLSNEYIPGKPLRWCCAKEHEWESKIGNIKAGCWCPICIGRYDHLEKMRQVAQERGGRCLADQYINIKHPVEWQCAKSHTWAATADSVLNNGRWCPHCSYRSEQAVREIFEQQTGQKFPKMRKILAEQRLELDGYCEGMRIAFEYQGIQHYEYVPHFHRNGPQDFESQKARDVRKYEQCLDAMVALIIVPYNQFDHEKYIRDQLVGML